jgi:hypothetical protein
VTALDDLCDFVRQFSFDQHFIGIRVAQIRIRLSLLVRM